MTCRLSYTASDADVVRLLRYTMEDLPELYTNCTVSLSQASLKL